MAASHEERGPLFHFSSCVPEQLGSGSPDFRAIFDRSTAASTTWTRHAPPETSRFRPSGRRGAETTIAKDKLGDCGSAADHRFGLFGRRAMGYRLLVHVVSSAVRVCPRGRSQFQRGEQMRCGLEPGVERDLVSRSLNEWPLRSIPFGHAGWNMFPFCSHWPCKSTRALTG